MVTASDGMGLAGELWLRGLGEMLLPLVADLNAQLAARPRDFFEAGARCRTLSRCIPHLVAAWTTHPALMLQHCAAVLATLL